MENHLPKRNSISIIAEFIYVSVLALKEWQEWLFILGKVK